MNVVPIRGQASGEDLERKWQDYKTAMERAQATLLIEDGIAAGRAWKAWLKVFENE